MWTKCVLALAASLATTLPVAIQAKTIIGDIVDKTGTPLRVKVSVDESPGELVYLPRNRKIVNEARADKTVICALYGVRSSCYQTRKRFYAEAPHYGANLIFERPIPLITIHLLGDLSRDLIDEWAQKSPAEILAEELKMPEADLQAGMQPDKMNHFVQYADTHHFGLGFYAWSYQPLEAVNDGKELAEALGKLSNIRPKNDCPNPESNPFRDGDTSLCAGVFKFSSTSGYSGFAYCTYTRVNDVSSTPTGCLAVYYTKADKSYVAVYSSPDIGTGEGAGMEGLNCWKKSPEADVVAKSRVVAADSAKTVTDVLRESKIGIDLRMVKARPEITVLYGVRAFEPSKILPNKYEYTTATLIVATKDGPYRLGFRNIRNNCVDTEFTECA